jgi:four helix bundle protein
MQCSVGGEVHPASTLEPMNTARLEHEKLRVYAIALEFLTLATLLVAGFPRGHAHLADQLRRAAMSICLNIAEGAGEFSRSEKARFYRIGRRSATECAAVLDMCVRLELGTAEQLSAGRALLIDIVSILTTMAKNSERQS